MTIPEAAQLVIQAGSTWASPCRIDDLVRRMVKLMGMTVRDLDHPDGDIEIAYTGLRPAEKLFEELLIGNNVTGTEHPMILRAIEHSQSSIGPRSKCTISSGPASRRWRTRRMQARSPTCKAAAPAVRRGTRRL
jgi:FlaA1/EpsC-like NDP-sugar epimerase